MKEIFTRRSVRSYTDQKISNEDMKLILQAAMAAPSAINQQPWEFIVVDDKALLEELGNCSPHSKFLPTAAACIIVLLNKNKVKCDLFQQDLSAVTENIMLEARYLGIGSCWIGTYTRLDRMAYVTKMFNLPEYIEPFSIISLGYPKDENAFVEKDRFNEELIHINKW